jgi:hypothetical protein
VALIEKTGTRLLRVKKKEEPSLTHGGTHVEFKDPSTCDVQTKLLVIAAALFLDKTNCDGYAHKQAGCYERNDCAAFPTVSAVLAVIFSLLMYFS